MYHWLLLLAVLHRACTLHNVTRSLSDSFTTGNCIKCVDYAAYCDKSFSTGCCHTCQCYYGKTYIFDKSRYICLASPAHDLGCNFHFRGHSKRGQSILSVKASSIASITQIGIMLLPKLVKTTCKFVHKDCVYWDDKKWTSLFTDGRQADDFFIENMKDNRRKAVKFKSYGKDESLYEGLLIKMAVSCQGIDPSCLMFKFKGTRSYGRHFEPTLKPTTSDKLSSTVLAKHEEKSGLSVGIIVGIVVVVLVFVLSIVLFVVVRRRMRKNHSEGVMKFTRSKKVGKSGKRLLKVNKDDKAVYQAPDVSRYFNQPSDADIDNPGYLIPVDSTETKEKSADEIIYQDVDALSKKKKDPNYDYPELKLKRKEELNLPPHEYAELVDKRKSNATTPTSDPCTGYTKLDVEKVNDGYQELQPVTNNDKSPTSPSSPKYFQLEHGDGDIEGDEEEVKI